MYKEVPCPECNGHGFHAKFNEYSAWSERCEKCGGTGIVKEPMTNADRIKSMSYEELALFQAKRYAEAIFREKADNGIYISETAKKALVSDLYKAWLQYLRKPAEED